MERDPDYEKGSIARMVSTAYVVVGIIPGSEIEVNLTS